MTTTIRKSAERGTEDAGWLLSRHTFSFGSYYDPRHMGFRALRVINDDTVAGGGGFPTHGHQDMEIVSYVLSGALAHKDSTGGSSTLRRGDVQRMTAGRGVRHSEFNGSQSEPVHFLQIWILPGQRSLQPGYQEAHVDDDAKRGKLAPLAAPSSSHVKAPLSIHQDVVVFASIVGAGDKLEHALAPGRGAWVQIADGEAIVDGQRVVAGDGVAIEGAGAVRIEGTPAGGELLLFDLA